jgi:hypothetical protein
MKIQTRFWKSFHFSLNMWQAHLLKHIFSIKIALNSSKFIFQYTRTLVLLCYISKTSWLGALRSWSDLRGCSWAKGYE